MPRDASRRTRHEETHPRQSGARRSSRTAHPSNASMAGLIASGDTATVQRIVGNRTTQSLLREMSAPVQTAGRRESGSPVVRRALAASKIAEPSYSDGLDLATIVSTALDKPPAPKMDGSDWSGKSNKKARQTLRAIFGDDQTTWDITDSRLLQPGQVHGNQVYDNKSGDLPDDSFLEYDVAKYAGDPKARGDKRVVIGVKAGVKKYYYTSNHYTDFAEFVPA